MRYLTVPLAALFALCINTACSDDDGGGGSGMAGEASGGAPSSSGGTGALVGANGGQAGGGGEGTGTCEAQAEALVADVGASTVALAVSDANVAYVTRVDASSPTDLAVVGIDGTGQEVIYTSPEGSAVESIAWSADDVLFLESVDGVATSQLFRIAATGGDPEQVGTGSFGEARLLGADADSAYLYTGAPTGAILRVALTAGTAETVGSIPGGGGILHPSISGDELFFVGGPGLQRVFRLAISDTDAEPSEVFNAAMNPGCGFPLGGLVATPTRLVCGYMDVAAFARDDGTPEGVIIDGASGRAAAHMVVASAGESVYMIEENDGTFDGTLRRANSDGSDETALVCDVGKVSTQTADGFFPISHHFQIAVGGERIVWIEERLAEGADVATVSIRSAPL